ncbi:hypothetical protein IDH44_20325 [Paenibacillus sp. IB182496]|uniref:Uncharacterized protein n=1 Tax=Paenibacillus sabuli TaxID=2772509 RepID=A0A927BVE1_9BACL|nr:hypothetical protein [Paenibacillus sabuli]MBD2847543.1 hypothetical protein [Paenibacillus sabuli]
MNVQQQAGQNQALYRMDPTTQRNLKRIQEHMETLCQNHAHAYVRVETVDGDVFEGSPVHCEKGILYLQMPSNGTNRAFVPGFQNNVVLPLVLYNLLVISLLY